MAQATPVRRKGGILRWGALTPLVLALVFMIPVLLLQIYLTLHQWTAYLGPWWSANFVGLEVFWEALTDERFLWALVRSFIFAGLSTLLTLLLGFGLAHLLQKPFRGRALYYLVFIIPMLTVPVVIGFTFQMLLYQDGPINQMLSIFVPGDIRISWLGDPTAAFATMVLIEVWNWTPFVMIIILAGLVSLPKEPVEAAQVMGASRFQIFAHVTLPLLKPVLLLAIILRFLEALAEFPKFWTITQGGPGTATETIPIYLYLTAWEYANVSHAAAMSYIVLLLVGTIIYFAIRTLLRQKQSLDVMFAKTEG
ncbi:MAG: sugar ABC transporter permease [Nitrospinota bacterium]|jgi:multiple sugar transport system permease protein|nr:sugar ABC transporter permease [Nitrospinota bacterium]